MRDWNHCLYNIVNRRLFVATNQTMNDRKEQTLRLNTREVALIRVPIEPKTTNFRHFTGNFDQNIVRVLELKLLPRFALMKQFELIVISLQPAMSLSSSQIGKRL